MKCLVTGASGFVGANLVHALVARGHRVKAWLRPGSEARGLRDVQCERICGNLEDRALLGAALRGCHWCFHVAASYHLWLPDYAPMYSTNVNGTRAVLEAAADAGCSRIVYTSTVGCIGLPRANNGCSPLPDESTPVTESQMCSHYKLSKWRAEAVAQGLGTRGAPVIIVNPSAPIGPWDFRPTPTGRVLVDYLNQRMPAYLDTGLNWVHVQDVAVGHILAAEKGRVGERYILGHAKGNWTMKQTFEVLEELTGIPAPRVRMPYWVALTAAHLNERLAKVTGMAPKAPLAGVRMARHKMWFNPSKSIEELGLPQTPPRQAFADAVAWFRAHGYAGG